jgi:hypothetical protein
MTERLTEEFLEPNASLESLRELGWYIQSNGHGWWFERVTGKDEYGEDKRERQMGVPYWVEQLQHRAGKVAELNTRNDFREALGLPPLKLKKSK